MANISFPVGLEMEILFGFLATRSMGLMSMEWACHGGTGLLLDLIWTPGIGVNQLAPPAQVYQSWQRVPFLEQDQELAQVQVLL